VAPEDTETRSRQGSGASSSVSITATSTVEGADAGALETTRKKKRDKKIKSPEWLIRQFIRKSEGEKYGSIAFPVGRQKLFLRETEPPSVSGFYFDHEMRPDDVVAGILLTEVGDAIARLRFRMWAELPVDFFELVKWNEKPASGAHATGRVRVRENTLTREYSTQEINTLGAAVLSGVKAASVIESVKDLLTVGDVTFIRLCRWAAGKSDQWQAIVNQIVPGSEVVFQGSRRRTQEKTGKEEPCLHLYFEVCGAANAREVRVLLGYLSGEFEAFHPNAKAIEVYGPDLTRESRDRVLTLATGYQSPTCHWSLIARALLRDPGYVFCAATEKLERMEPFVERPKFVPPEELDETSVIWLTRGEPTENRREALEFLRTRVKNDEVFSVNLLIRANSSPAEFGQHIVRMRVVSGHERTGETEYHPSPHVRRREVRLPFFPKEETEIRDEDRTDAADMALCSQLRFGVLPELRIDAYPLRLGALAWEPGDEEDLAGIHVIAARYAILEVRTQVDDMRQVPVFAVVPAEITVLSYEGIRVFDSRISYENQGTLHEIVDGDLPDEDQQQVPNALLWHDMRVLLAHSITGDTVLVGHELDMFLAGLGLTVPRTQVRELAENHLVRVIARLSSGGKSNFSFLKEGLGDNLCLPEVVKSVFRIETGRDEAGRLSRTLYESALADLLLYRIVEQDVEAQASRDADWLGMLVAGAGFPVYDMQKLRPHPGKVIPGGADREKEFEDPIAEYQDPDIMVEGEVSILCQDSKLLYSIPGADPAGAATQVVGAAAYRAAACDHMMERFRQIINSHSVYGPLLAEVQPNTARQVVQMRSVPASFVFSSLKGAREFALDREFDDPVKAGRPLSVFTPEVQAGDGSSSSSSASTSSTSNSSSSTVRSSDRSTDRSSRSTASSSSLSASASVSASN
jgi:hypothetical protein